MNPTPRRFRRKVERNSTFPQNRKRNRGRTFFESRSRHNIEESWEDVEEMLLVRAWCLERRIIQLSRIWPQIGGRRRR